MGVNERGSRNIFLLSLFYISTTTRHTLENRRFLEANSNEKFCGTIRETLCECAAPSSMESYIYNIVSRICVCPVCINALSDCVIVYSGFCGCIIILLRVLVSFFLSFISHYYYYFHMIFPCLLIFTFLSFLRFLFLFFSYSLTQRFSRAISHHTFSPLARSDSHSHSHCFAHSHRVLFFLSFLGLCISESLRQSCIFSINRFIASFGSSISQSDQLTLFAILTSFL